MNNQALNTPQALIWFRSMSAWLCRQMAQLGGVIMLLLATMTVVSIIGRSLFGVAVDGDYEMVEVGLGIAVFLFLPECHIKSGHVVVDIFTNGLSAPTRARLDAMGEVLFAAAAIVMIWQLWLGGMDAFDYEEQSMILELPLWIVFVPGVIANVIILLNSIDRFSRMIAGERV